MNAMIEIDKKQLTALILAGGKSSRMEGNDKGLLQINNKYIIQYLHSLAEKFCTNLMSAYLSATKLLTSPNIVENFPATNVSYQIRYQ